MLLYFIVLIIRANLEINLLPSYSLRRLTALKNLCFISAFMMLFIYIRCFFPCTHILYPQTCFSVGQYYNLWTRKYTVIPRKSPRVLSDTFIIPPNVFSQEPPQIFHFDENDRLNSFFLFFCFFFRFHLPREGLQAALRGFWQAVRQTVISPPHYRNNVCSLAQRVI